MDGNNETQGEELLKDYAKENLGCNQSRRRCPGIERIGHRVEGGRNPRTIWFCELNRTETNT